MADNPIIGGVYLKTWQSGDRGSYIKEIIDSNFNELEERVQLMERFFNKYPDLLIEEVYGMKYTWFQRVVLRLKARLMTWWIKLTKKHKTDRE